MQFAFVNKESFTLEFVMTPASRRDGVSETNVSGFSSEGTSRMEAV